MELIRGFYETERNYNLLIDDLDKLIKDELGIETKVFNLERKIEKLSQLYDFLRRESANKLKDSFLSGLVDEEFRIKPDIYSSIYDEIILTSDSEKISKIEQEINEYLSKLDEDKKLKKQVGKLKSAISELTKALFCDKLFGERFIVVRTSLYDDYINGIDEIFLDKKTKIPFVAIDISNYEKLKEKSFDVRKIKKRGVLWGKILGGSYLKYGCHLTENNKIEINGLVQVPTLSISLNFVDILKIIKAYLENNENEIKRIGKEILMRVLEFFEKELFEFNEEKEIVNISQSAINNFLRYFEFWVVEKEHINMLRQFKKTIKNMTIEDLLQLDTKVLSLFELTELYYGLKTNQEISRFRLERLKI